MPAIRSAYGIIRPIVDTDVQGFEHVVRKLLSYFNASSGNFSSSAAVQHLFGVRYIRRYVEYVERLAIAFNFRHWTYLDKEVNSMREYDHAGTHFIVESRYSASAIIMIRKSDKIISFDSYTFECCGVSSRSDRCMSMETSLITYIL